MASFKRAFGYGLLVWVIPLGVAMFAFPLRESERAFFESIMAVILALAAVLAANLYFKKVSSHFLKEGVAIGVVFMGVSLVLDLALFSKGPMAMPLIDYFKDIGFTYLMIPVITIGTGYLLEHKKHTA